MRSPIDRMIDEACGLTPEKIEEKIEQLRANRKKLFLTLRCPSCGKEQQSRRTPDDPPNAALMLMACPDHFPAGETVPVEYRDENGTVL